MHGKLTTPAVFFSESSAVPIRPMINKYKYLRVPRLLYARNGPEFFKLFATSADGNMAERPSKKSKRTDSSAMWDKYERRGGKERTGNSRHQEPKEKNRSPEPLKDDPPRHRYRSRSRERYEGRRPHDEDHRTTQRRSRSRDRERDHRDRHSERPREHRDRKHKDRSRSPDRRLKGAHFSHYATHVV